MKRRQFMELGAASFLTLTGSATVVGENNISDVGSFQHIDGYGEHVYALGENGLVHYKETLDEYEVHLFEEHNDAGTKDLAAYDGGVYATIGRNDEHLLHYDNEEGVIYEDKLSDEHFHRIIPSEDGDTAVLIGNVGDDDNEYPKVRKMDMVNMSIIWEYNEIHQIDTLPSSFRGGHWNESTDIVCVTTTRGEGDWDDDPGEEYIVVGIDGSTGDEIWRNKHKTDRGVSGAAATYVDNDIVYVTDTSAIAVGLDPETGNKLWEIDLMTDERPRRAVKVDQGLVITHLNHFSVINKEGIIIGYIPNNMWAPGIHIWKDKVYYLEAWETDGPQFFEGNIFEEFSINWGPNWDQKMASTRSTQPTIYDSDEDRLFSVGSQGDDTVAVRELDPETGEIIEGIMLESITHVYNMFKDGDELICSILDKTNNLGNEGGAAIVDIGNGLSLKWKSTTQGYDSGYSPVHGYDDDYVYAVGKESVAAKDRNDGSTVWVNDQVSNLDETTYGTPRLSTRAQSAGDYVLFGGREENRFGVASGRKFLCVEKETGNEVWSRDIEPWTWIEDINGKALFELGGDLQLLSDPGDPNSDEWTVTIGCDAKNIQVENNIAHVFGGTGEYFQVDIGDGSVLLEEDLGLGLSADEYVFNGAISESFMVVGTQFSVYAYERNGAQIEELSSLPFEVGQRTSLAINDEKELIYIGDTNSGSVMSVDFSGDPELYLSYYPPEDESELWYNPEELHPMSLEGTDNGVDVESKVFDES